MAASRWRSTVCARCHAALTPAQTGPYLRKQARPRLSCDSAQSEAADQSGESPWAGPQPAMASATRVSRAELPWRSQRRVDEALREVVGVADELAHAPTHGPCRRDETRQHDDAGVGQDARQVGHAPHILRAVLVGEAQVRVEAVAEITARGPNA